jgi:hypothetical protein
MTPEGRIKKMVTKGLDAIEARHPGKVTRWMPVLRGMGRPMLDYVLCVNGHFVMIETKRDAKHKPTPIQLQTIASAWAAGARVWVIYDQQTCDDALSAIETLIC